MPTKNWETLSTNEQRTLLENVEPSTLSKRFDRHPSFFSRAKAFFDGLPVQTVDPTPRPHNPSKDLVVSARRDLSFFEANFELFDNSVDAWRRLDTQKDLHISVAYDLELLTGKYSDDAGGMDDADVYKVFIPGETTNRDYSEAVIGSFGMGAKKGIFRLTDGAKIISCRSSKFSATSEVPEKWEAIPSWETLDGRAKATHPGTTEIYLYKLFDPPTLEEIDELVRRTGIVYAPLLSGKLLGKRIHIRINDVQVEPCPEINWSNPKGAEPRTYEFSHVFTNFLDTGNNINLSFQFRCGLTRKLPGKAEFAEPDWGIDVYGNGRLIERFLKDPFGFGTSGLSKGTSGTKHFRGQLFVNGHSFAIPWDTHKREYLHDHEVSRWVRRELRPIIKEFVTIAGRFASDANLRNTVLAATSPSPKAKTPILKFPVENKTPEAVQAVLPTWEYETKSDKKTAPSKSAVAVLEDDEESLARLAESNNDERTIALSLTAADYDELLQRFDATCEEELGSVVRDCLLSGVVFTLEPAKLTQALEFFKCEGNVGKLSDRIRRQLLKKISE